jgi:hypothetical protein
MRVSSRASSLTLLAALIALVVGLARPAEAQQGCLQDPATVCSNAANSTWLGDINNDGRVTGTDIDVWVSCIRDNFGSNGQSVYCPEGDLNFDGSIDDTDLNYLNHLVAMASDPSVGKLPRSLLSELRIRKPNSQTDPLISQSRYVEIRTPTTAANVAGAPTVNQSGAGDPGTIRRYGDGWYYLKVARSNSLGGNDVISGTIAVVVSLKDMPWVVDPFDTISRGLSLVADSSFYDPPVGQVSPLLAEVPPSLVDSIFELPSGDSLAMPATSGAPPDTRIFPAENSTNVTHLIVFRRPAGGGTPNPRAVPAVGQRVNNPNAICELAWTVSQAVPVGSLPPWDAIADCVTIVKGTTSSTYGCIYGNTGTSAIGPVGNPGGTYAPPHIYVCRATASQASSLTKGPDAITVSSDTPFRRNPSCQGTGGGCGENNADGTARDCFQPQSGPYCSDADCCNAVCQISPTCCSLIWDESCVTVASTTCVTCGTSLASCYVPHNTPSCEDADCCTRVCTLDPSCCETPWDSGCANLAISNCLACGSSDGACDEVHSLPYCNDVDCCDRVCQTNPFCCNVTWDFTCVQTAEAVCSGCGNINAGPCCIAHGSPYCNDGKCCAAVCALDPYCCESGWDISCTQVAQVTPACVSENCVCGGQVPPGGEISCFTVHTAAGCTDTFCCQTVCLHDPYCCYVTWDQSCVDVANDFCSTVAGCINDNSLPVNGSCFIVHSTPGCDKPGCCSAVCSEAAYAHCCNFFWDELCAIRASEICDDCGDPLAGSCFQAHASPNCADATCCNSVCNIDPFCCDGTWDGVCVATAALQCASPLAACGETERSCWIPNYQPGCSDSTCCTSVCRDIDPFCCEARWDAVCAREATFICTPDFVVTIGREGCLNAHASLGCANLDCSRAVCSVDPTCCTTAWDQGCVSAAIAVCAAPESCPGVGDCFASHGSPGCEDSACCNGVCNADPSCCQGEWDSTCTSIARILCKVPAKTDWNCPCSGSCFESHNNGGCSDGSCCAIVCNLSPSCCDTNWDNACVSLARSYCCGAPGCGSGCNKSCLIPHEEPYCSDPYCCDAICRADPLCCSATWDTLCAASALERCGSACGLSEAGNCFIEHDLPGCKDGNCCAAVCEIDAFCCTNTWDDTCVEYTARPELATKCVKVTCGDRNAGEPCTPHPSQASNNEPCCTQVCAQDNYCCETEWDSSCVDIAREIAVCGCSFECGDDCAGDCCRGHDNGGCKDRGCCNLICSSDPYCCDTVWDSVCASNARFFCTGKDDACPVPPCGSDLLTNCCVVSPLPNCSDSACCTRVCQTDPFCCQVSWDNPCVQAAAENSACDCNGSVCGGSGTGSCFRVHSTPNCDEAGCCESVCAFREECCTVSWDSECVAIAEVLCGGGFNGLLDAYRGGPLGETRGRALPPSGWIPPRQRANIREPKELPPSVALPKRPASPPADIPRSDGIEVKPGRGSTATPVPGGKATFAPAPGKSVGGK